MVDISILSEEEKFNLYKQEQINCLRKRTKLLDETVSVEAVKNLLHLWGMGEENNG